MEEIINTGIYIRVSTEEQVKDGFSIHAQKEKLTMYAKINDWKIYDYYIDDGISGKNIEARPEIKRMIKDSRSKMLRNLYEELDSLEDIYELIEEAIVDEPPMTIKEGGLIKLGYNEEIDHLKQATTEGKTWIIELEAREREQTRNKGIKSRI